MAAIVLPGLPSFRADSENALQLSMSDAEHYLESLRLKARHCLWRSLVEDLRISRGDVRVGAFLAAGGVLNRSFPRSPCDLIRSSIPIHL